jgi:hypothetical protein
LVNYVVPGYSTKSFTVPTRTYGTYIPLAINPPEKTIENLDGLSCNDQLQGNENTGYYLDCEVSPLGLKEIVN